MMNMDTVVHFNFIVTVMNWELVIAGETFTLHCIYIYLSTMLKCAYRLVGINMLAFLTFRTSASVSVPSQLWMMA